MRPSILMRSFSPVRLLVGLAPLGVIALGASLGFIGSGCGAADAVRPEAPTADEATGKKCDPKSDITNVFVVDLPPETRSDLELALGAGSLAVASFDCKEVKILRNCKASGAYAFRGTSAKERVLSLENGDAIRAALPLGGAGIAASFEAEASTGMKFDLGLVIAGQMVGSSSSFSAAELTGACNGATHVITAAKMGAFAMGTSSKAELKTAAEVFGAGAGASSSSSKLTKARDGSLKACEAAESGSEKAPKGCDALLALEVTKLVADVGEVDEDGMGDLFLGLVFSDLKCKDAEACEAGCNAGKGRSCTELGVALVDGGLGDKNLPRGRQLLKKGCELGDMKGCSAYADVIGFVDSRVDEAIQYAEKACTVGNDGYACSSTAVLYGKKGNKEKEKKFESKACMAGYEPACPKKE